MSVFSESLTSRRGRGSRDGSPAPTQSFRHSTDEGLYMSRTFFILGAICFIAFGCASPPYKELEAARRAMSKAYASGARELSPRKYQTAVEVLENGEELVTRGQYGLAKETLPYAEALAQQAIHAAREEQIRRDAEEIIKNEKLELLKKQLQKEAERNKPQTKPTPQIITRPTPKKIKSPPPPPPVTEYMVGNGETLWSISARKQVYLDPFLWPLIYRANRDQIKDPKQIYPGQELNIPRNLKQADLNEARATAKKSEIFPLNLLMKASTDNEH
jgi:LysM repeat protein